MSDVLSYRLTSLWQKKLPDGTRRFPEVNSVLVVPDTHHVISPRNTEWPLMMSIADGGIHDPHLAVTIEHHLMMGWAGYNTLPLVTRSHLRQADIQALEFKCKR